MIHDKYLGNKPLNFDSKSQHYGYLERKEIKQNKKLKKAD